MAVFPDRIILKNSADTQSEIEAAIGSGGSDEITYGELVIGRETGSVKLYSIDASGAVVTVGGGFEYGDISPYLAMPGTYTQRHSFNSVPPTGKWSANTTQLIFPATAANGLNLNTEFGSTNPGTIGISDNGVDFTYYTCTAWDYQTTYFRATLTGLDAQDFYDLGDRPIWADFGPKANPLEGYTFVYETAINAFKIKKNSIGNQSDFDYQKEVSVYEFNFNTADINTPSSGDATVWSGYGDDDIFLSTTDRNAVDAETDLFLLEAGDNVVMSVNGSVVFSGALTNVQNKNLSRISLNFGSVQSWITNLQSGDIVGIKSDEVFSLQAEALPASDGQVITWVDADSKWRPVDPASTVSAIDDLSDVTITAAADGEVLRHNGTAWVDATLDYGDLSVTASQLRTTLGIGEYADDTAAGTGGVASGALYYNTTSSDYRLKT